MATETVTPENDEQAADGRSYVDTLHDRLDVAVEECDALRNIVRDVVIWHRDVAERVIERLEKRAARMELDGHHNLASNERASAARMRADIERSEKIREQVLKNTGAALK